MAHGENHRLICPICLKRFEAEHAVKAHQQRKRHMTHRMVDQPWAKYAPRGSKTGEAR